MRELLVREGIPLRRQGTRWVAPCPFHEEKSASFGTDEQRPGHAHCFGCGWDGSIFDFWMQWREVDFHTAVEHLAALGGLNPLTSVSWKSGPRKVTPVTQAPLKISEKPPLPRMRPLKEAEIEQLAALRGLSVQGVRLAALTYRRVAWSLWPLWPKREWGRIVRWTSPCKVHFFECNMEHGDCEPIPCYPSWCVTDDQRRVAEFRRLDGLMYPRGELTADGWKQTGEIKAWSTKGKSWPLGAAELGERKNAILTEGGPDMLAAYHFLWGFGQLHRVGVVDMLGCSNRIAEDALPYFKRCQVRIFVDADRVKEKKHTRKDGTVSVTRTRPGMDAAARWTEQLCAAGATVKGFDFTDQAPDPENGLPASIAMLRRIDGAPVKDLNDLARCDAEVVDHPFIKSAFFDFDF